MITLTVDGDELKDLNTGSIRKFFVLLQITTPPNVYTFLKLEEGERDFYSFFFDVLIENDVPCAIDVDWKWEPEIIFDQLKQVPGSNLTFVESTLDENEVYTIIYRHGTNLKNLQVGFSDPSMLLEALQNDMESKEFIALDFFEDRFSWLIVPREFDVQAFCVLTGVANKPKETKPAEEVPEFFREGRKLPEKIFFSPDIVYVGSNQAGYEMPNQVWGGRVLPGQTVREGIATELMGELRYAGRFDYMYDGYRGTFPDRKGQDIKQYGVKIYLYDKTFQSKMAGGADIKLRKIVGKKFTHPDKADK